MIVSPSTAFQSLKSLISRVPWQRVLHWLVVLVCISGALLLIDVWFHVLVRAYSQSLNFSGYPTNGAFQLFNPLRRLADGQRPGVDFQFFHGLGVVFAHYPLFQLFGKNLFASEMSRWIMSPSLFIISNFVIIYAFTRRWGVALALSAVHSVLWEYAYAELYLPLNSILGVRSTFPILIGALLFAVYSTPRWEHYRQSYWFFVALGCAGSLAFFFGTEHGLATIVALTLTMVCFHESHAGWVGRFKATGMMLGACIVSTVILFAAITRGPFFIPLQYSLVEVPSDQFWYFGVPPNYFLTSLTGALENEYIIVTIVVGLILFIITLFIHYFKTDSRRRVLPIIFLLLYGLVSNVPLLSSYIEHYSEPLMRLIVIIIVWLGLVVLPTVLTRYVPFKACSPKSLQSIIFIVLFITGLSVAHNRIPNITTDVELLSLTEQQEGIRRSGVYLDPQWVQSYTVSTTAIGFDDYVIPASINDKNWSNGIYKSLPGFVVNNTPTIRDLLHVGDTLFFYDSGVQHIRALQDNGVWLIVYTDGHLLTVKDGFPNKIYINGLYPGNNPSVVGTIDNPAYRDLPFILPYQVTDDNWNRGISRTATPSTFVVPYSVFIESTLAVGDTLFFHKSGKRTISAIEIASPWIIISVNEPIHGATDGYPHKIYVNKDVSTYKPKIWSTYAGLLEAEYSMFHPGDDYIIHALGPKRRREYDNKFAEYGAHYVTTMRRAFFLYEDWLMNEHWKFYELVLNNYDVIATTPDRLIWKRTNNAWNTPALSWEGEITVAPNDPAITLSFNDSIDTGSSEYSLVVVEVDYTINNPWHAVPYLNNMPRYFITPRGSVNTTPVSLPPYETTWQFPLIISRGSPVTLSIDTASLLPGAEFTVHSIRYRQSDASPLNIDHLVDINTATISAD